jgi:hypothetical protein
MFTRCIAEPQGYEGQVQDILDESFDSEFQASQECWSTNQILDYDQLIPRVHWANVSTDIYQHHGEVQFISRSFYEKCKRLPIIFPTVQRKKNIARESATIYHSIYPQVPIEEVTTSHLQKHYFYTGEQIGGSCEMRRAWKYNDLKPRFYYCIGGKSYWPSCYIKKIAQTLMEAIPSTTIRRRRDLSTDMEDDFENYYATTWDFKAFTTRLSELKYFLYYVAVAIEEHGEVILQLFDYKEGVIDYPLSDLIHEYNNAINNQDTFTIFRLQDVVTSNLDFHATYHQQNSGMLGVPGNIGFSTALHGFEICRICGRDKCACVGDDGFAISYFSNNTILIPHLSQIGVVHPEKTSELRPNEPGPMRYTKRALYRSEDNRFRIDKLLTFPLAAIIDGEDLPFHTPLQLDQYKRRKVFSVSTSALLWDIQSIGIEDIADIEIDLLREFLRQAYKRLGLPVSGALPGYSIRNIGRILFAVPCIDFSLYDPRTTDWLEFMFDQTYTYQISIPLVGDSGLSSDIPLYGEELVVARHPVWKILEDLDIVTIEALSESVEILSEDNRRRLRSVIKTSHSFDRQVQMIRVNVINDVPESFHSLFVPLPIVDDQINLLGMLAEI